MKERAKQAQERAKKAESPVQIFKKEDIQTNTLSVMQPVEPQIPVQNILEVVHPYDPHTDVTALSDISLNLLSFLPPTLIAALSFRLLRNAEVNAAPALMISGGLAWLGYKAAAPMIFEEKAVARLRY